MMRIISGSARGTRLATLEGESTRPTLERVKEALFSMIQFEISGARVLDLFSGSGQLALEALSRGAASADAVDSSSAAIAVITKNIKATHMENKCSIRRMTAEGFLQTNAGRREYDLVFLDPPYASNLIDESVSLLIERGLVKKSTVIICESDRFDILGVANSEKCDIIKTMKHGVAHISVLKLKGAEEE